MQMSNPVSRAGRAARVMTLVAVVLASTGPGGADAAQVLPSYSFTAQNTSMDSFLQLQKLVGSGIYACAYTPDNKGCVIVTDTGQYYASNIPQDCLTQLRAYLQAGHMILNIAFPPAGPNSWSIITDRGFSTKGIPEACYNQMLACFRAGDQLMSVAFPPIGGDSWVITTDRSFYARGIPANCLPQMWTLFNKGLRFRCVAFPPAGGDRWALITLDGQFYARNLPSDAFGVMNYYASHGHQVMLIAYTPLSRNGYVVLAN